MRNKIRVRVEQKPDADCDGRTCSIYVFEDPEREQSPLYRKSVHTSTVNGMFRSAWRTTRGRNRANLEGSALDEATLIEYYVLGHRRRCWTDRRRL